MLISQQKYFLNNGLFFYFIYRFIVFFVFLEKNKKEKISLFYIPSSSNVELLINLVDFSLCTISLSLIFNFPLISIG